MEYLDIVPEHTDKYTEWVNAEEHLALLRDNANQTELIVYGVNRSIFVHSVVASEKKTPYPWNKKIYLDGAVTYSLKE